MKRLKSLQERQEELKRRILLDGKTLESWHLDQNVSPSPIPVSAILNPKILAKQELRVQGGFTPSHIEKCKGSGHSFMISLREFWESLGKIVTKCPDCERKIRIRLVDEAKFTREYSATFPAERVMAYVVFHRVATKPRTKKSTL